MYKSMANNIVSTLNSCMMYLMQLSLFKIETTINTKNTSMILKCTNIFIQIYYKQ